ncbi:DUF6723 family protein [Paraburkholderia caribensis]|uniref:DUF6723 family protein n=1 Tax=Paraburkholderia caribensis TaxID=75105 RepID=UPI003863F28C
MSGEEIKSFFVRPMGEDYPFDGAPPIGPFSTVQAARHAASAHASKLIEADIENPE